MMSKVYALFAAFVVGLAVGFAGTYAHTYQTIAELEASINAANQMSDALLQSHIKAKKQADADSEQLSSTIEAQYDQKIATANADIARLRANRATRHSNAVSVGECAGVSENGPGHGFRDRCEELLGRALKINIWKQAALLELQNNCGIQQALK